MRSTLGPLSIRMSRSRKSGLLTSGFVASTIGELFADKLPFIPNRTAPQPLLGRIAFGVGCGFVLARESRRSGLEGALLGGASALLASFLCVPLRRALGKATTPVLGGLIEDGLALAACSWVARSGRA